MRQVKREQVEYRKRDKERKRERERDRQTKVRGEVKKGK